VVIARVAESVKFAALKVASLVPTGVYVDNPALGIPISRRFPSPPPSFVLAAFEVMFPEASNPVLISYCCLVTPSLYQTAYV